MKNKKNILILIVIIVLTILLTYFITTNINKTITIESLKVFGKNIDIQENKNVYRISMESATIDEINNGCTQPLEIKTRNNIGYNTISYYQDGDNLAYFFIKLENNTNSKVEAIETFDYYIEINLKEPLNVSEECKIN